MQVAELPRQLSPRLGKLRHALVTHHAPHVAKHQSILGDTKLRACRVSRGLAHDFGVEAPRGIHAVGTAADEDDYLSTRAKALRSGDFRNRITDADHLVRQETGYALCQPQYGAPSTCGGH